MLGTHPQNQNNKGYPLNAILERVDLSPVELLPCQFPRPCTARFGQQPSLAASLVIRLGAVLDVETADEAARKGAARLLNTSLAPFIVNKGVYS